MKSMRGSWRRCGCMGGSGGELRVRREPPWQGQGHARPLPRIGRVRHGRSKWLYCSCIALQAGRGWRGATQNFA